MPCINQKRTVKTALRFIESVTKRGNNMKKIKGLFSAALCIVLAFNMFGCSDGDNVVEEQLNTKHISLSWWGGDSRHTYMMEGVSVFEQLNEDIRVDCKYGIWNGYSKRQNIFMKSNDEPDVMLINYSWISDYSPEGDGFYDIYDLTDYVDLSTFTDEELAYGEVNGHLNAIPIAFNVETLYYNKDLYDKYNIPLPTTWEDFFAAAKIMGKDGIYPIGMGDKAAFFFVLSYFEQTTGKSACDEDGRLLLTKEDIGYMLKFYKRLIDERVMPPVQQYDRNLFSQGKAGATVGWVSDVDRYCSILIERGANVVVGAYPRAEYVKRLGWYVKPATMYAISKHTEEPEAAARLLEFLINSREMALLQKDEKGIPISDSALEVLEHEDMLNDLAADANQQIADNQEYLSKMNTVFEAEDVYLSFINESTYYLYGKMTLDEVEERLYNEFYKQ